MLIEEPKNIILNASRRTRNHLRNFFGGIVPDAKLAALVGALDDSVIEITTRGNGFVSTAKHKFLIEQIRIGGSSQEFGLFITNEFFQLAGDAPQGIGLVSFTRQVIAARELGFSFIRTYAEGSAHDPDGFIGYYVWARFGFNAPLNEDETIILPTEIKGCNDLNELMLRPEGHEWWRQNGSARDMIFLLSDGELSLTVLRNYLEEKGVKTEL